MGRKKKVKMIRCPVEKKVKYSSEDKAVQAIITSSVLAGRGRVYLCPHCWGWHVTSQEKKRA